MSWLLGGVGACRSGTPLPPFPQTTMIKISAASSLVSRLPGFKFAWAQYQGVNVQVEDGLLRQEIMEQQHQLRKTFTLETLARESGLLESRRAFKALGLDPARYRPSQEALLRRVIKGQDLYFINSGVDVCNLLSIRHCLPMGLYDADKIFADLTLRSGTAADVYSALNERDVQCENKLILCDGQGPIGSPYVDSKRTGVSGSTTHFLHVVYFCHARLDPDIFADMRQTIVQYHGGTGSEYQFIQT